MPERPSPAPPPATVGLSFLLVLTIASFGPASAGGPDTPARITSFAGVPWGASEDTVVLHHGHPRFESLIGGAPGLELAVRPESMEGGKRMIYLNLPPYRDAITTAFYVHPSRGLFKGVTRFEPSGPDRCRETYRAVKERVRTWLEAPGARESGRDPPDHLSFCGAVRIGAAFRVTDWVDPGSPARVRVALKRGSSDVWLEVFSPDWVRRVKRLNRFRTLMILHRQGRRLDP